MFRLTTANPAKLKKLIKIVLQVPTLQLRHAMKAANYTDDEISDIAFRCFLQRNSPGGLIQGLRAHVAAGLPAPPDQAERHRVRTTPTTITSIKRTLLGMISGFVSNACVLLSPQRSWTA